MGSKEQDSNGIITSEENLCNCFDKDGGGSLDGEEPDTPVVEDSHSDGQ